MKAIAVLAGVAALALAPAAHAGVVAQMKLGSSADDLVVGPDGGAWIFIDRPGPDAVGRAGPDGRFRTAATDEFSVDGVLGPDGNAWYRIGPAQFLRANAQDALDTVGDDVSNDPLDNVMAVGPDGALWSPTGEGDGFWHMTPDGKRAAVRAPLPAPCGENPEFADMVKASDGAIWLADAVCARLIRVGPDGSTKLDLEIDPEDLAADRSGGVWVSGSLDTSVVHVDASGKVVTTIDLPDDALFTDDVAVAPDDSAWFAGPRCRLLRVTPAGQVTTARAPIHVSELEFDPAGGLWLAGDGGLAHLAPGEPSGPCDTRAPSVRISPGGSSISLRRLRRLGAFTITVREPATVVGLALYYDGVHRLGSAGDLLERTVRAPQGDKLRYRVTRRQLRRLARALAAGRKPSVNISAVSGDVEGNSDVETVIARIKP